MSSVIGRMGLGACAALVFSAIVVAWQPAEPALATEKTTEIQVSARVQPWARLECQNRSEELRVNAEDVRTGYKEQKVRCTVVTNDRRGAIVRFVPRAGLGTLISIKGLSQPLVMQQEPVEVWQAPDAVLELEIRFNLRSALVPGLYPVPLLMHATPVSDSAPPQL